MGWRLPACRLLRRVLEPFGRVRGGKSLQAAHRRNSTACRCTAGSMRERLTARQGTQRATASALTRRRGRSLADERLRLARTSAAAPHVDGAAGDEVCAPHEPVLLEEILEAFSTVGVGVFVDGTIGAGGHSSAIRRAHPEVRYHVGIDQDPTALALAAQALQPLYPRHRAFQLQDGKLWPAAPTSLGQVVAGDAGREAGQEDGGGQQAAKAQLLLCRSNFRQVRQVLGSLDVPGRNGGLAGLVDGMLLDLGMSSMQVDTAERGFSFQQDGPIDMRMDPDAALSAEDVVNTWSEAELGRILRDFGEERMWRRVAQRIVAARAAQPIRSTAQLVRAIGRTSPRRKGSPKGKGVHPATRTFQALRIAVNQELAVLEQVLPDAVDCLAPGGKLAVISFHRLEDRIVKTAFLTAAGRAPMEPVLGKNVGRRMQMVIAEAQEQKSLQERKATVLTKRPLVASEQEVAANPRSRSARLRILQRI